jgi:hypothetical protein
MEEKELLHLAEQKNGPRDDLEWRNGQHKRRFLSKPTNSAFWIISFRGLIQLVKPTNSAFWIISFRGNFYAKLSK